MLGACSKSEPFVDPEPEDSEEISVGEDADGFKEDEMLTEEVFKYFIPGQNCILNLLGIIKAVLDLFVLLLLILLNVLQASLPLGMI